MFYQDLFLLELTRHHVCVNHTGMDLFSIWASLKVLKRQDFGMKSLHGLKTNSNCLMAVLRPAYLLKIFWPLLKWKQCFTTLKIMLLALIVVCGIIQLQFWPISVIDLNLFYQIGIVMSISMRNSWELIMPRYSSQFFNVS